MSAPAPPRRGRALALAVEHGVDDLYQGVVPALVPVLVALRHYSYAQAGGIVLAATVMSSLAQPVFGLLADRHRVPWLRSAGLLAAAGGIGAVGLAPSYLATCLAVLVSGLGIAAYHPEAARAVHATATGDRGMGWFVFGGLAGFAVGAPVAGLILGTLGLGATPLLALPAVVAAIAGVSTMRHAAAAPVGTTATAARDAREDWAGFGWLTAVVMARSVLFYGLSAFLAIDVTTRLGASPAQATLALTAFTGVGALATLASSRITARLGRARTLLASYVIAAAALAVLLGAGSVAVAVVAAGVVGVALSVPVPVHTTLGQAYLPRHLGLASAVTLGLAVSTGGLASPALGALADRVGVGAALLALLALPVLAAALALPLRRRAGEVAG